jgi:L-cysteine:1D-myo-inositol 2-amino-2-deoxy-alpha-D-glucopyranoside ligase
MIELFDTPTQQLTTIKPKGDVSIYVCGITPYDSAHVGHIFTFLAYDLLQRRLEDLGHTVKLVRNITDVDEPIYKKASENGEDYRQLAQRETESFQATMLALNFRKPFAEPKASEYIGPMAEATEKLLKEGFGYRVDNDVYFDVSKAQDFGSFSGFSNQLQSIFMANRGGDPERPGKRNPLDFLLWRGIQNPHDQAAWESPIGRGRPGWHIECSIMSAATLGTPLTIHGGGMDLIFPHHECEIAQSTALGHHPLARHWMHVAPILYQGEKMSKSLGNLVFARDLLRSHKPGVIRLAMMQLHYRTGGEWRHDAIGCAQDIYDELGRALSHPYQLGGSKYLTQVREALDDDLDTHSVLHVLREAARSTIALTADRKTSPNTARPQLAEILLLLGLANIAPHNVDTADKSSEAIVLV